MFVCASGGARAARQRQGARRPETPRMALSSDEQMGRLRLSPLNPERVRTRAERLKLEGALPTPQKGDTFGEDHPRAFIVREGDYPVADETFEAIDFDESGGVTIWTQRLVIALEHAYTMERFAMIG